MQRSFLDLVPADVRREEAFDLTPRELIEYGATSAKVAAALNDESFCRDYYNRRVPADLQLTEPPLEIPFCELIRALPSILSQLTEIQTTIMQWERCVVPEKEKLNRNVNSAQFSRCVDWSSGRDSIAIQIAEAGDHLYVLSPWNSDDPHIRLELRVVRESRRGPSAFERVGEWRVPLALLRPLLVALVATEGHLFENTENYDIVLIQSLPSPRIQMEQRETAHKAALMRRSDRELPFRE